MKAQRKVAPVEKLDSDLALLGPLAREFFANQGIVALDCFLTTRIRESAEALKAFMFAEKNTSWAQATAETNINEWRGYVRQRLKNRKNGLQGLHHSAFQVFTPEVLDYLITRSIRTPTDLLGRNRATETQAFFDWRDIDSRPVLWGSARTAITKCMSAVKSQYTVAELEQMKAAESKATAASILDNESGRYDNYTNSKDTVVSSSEEATGSLVVSGDQSESPGYNRKRKTTRPQQLDRDLVLLGPMARDFVTFQKISDRDSFLDTTGTLLAQQLVDYLIARKHRTIAASTACVYVSEWKTYVRQRVKNREQGLQGLHHSAFQVFTQEVLDYLITRSMIRTPVDLLECVTATEAQAFLDWRETNNLKQVPLSSAKATIYKWKTIVRSQYTAEELEQMENTVASETPSGARSASSNRKLCQNVVTNEIPTSETPSEESATDIGPLDTHNSLDGNTVGSLVNSSEDEDLGLVEPKRQRASLNVAVAVPVVRKRFVYNPRIALSLLTEERLRGHLL